MAIPLKKFAQQCEEVAMGSGSITPQTSPTVSLYDISRRWRELCQAARHSRTKGGWTAREKAAASVVIATLTYLRRIGCKDVERLLRDTLESQRQPTT